jgi:hypothetical protein
VNSTRQASAAFTSTKALPSAAYVTETFHG